MAQGPRRLRRDVEGDLRGLIVSASDRIEGLIVGNETLTPDLPGLLEPPVPAPPPPTVARRAKGSERTEAESYVGEGTTSASW
jgi:hypothetical protein